MPVLIVSPNGTITERPNLVTAFQHATQPDPHLVNTAKKTLIVTTSMTLGADVIVAQNSGIEIRICNDAVVTIPSGRTLNLTYAEFQRPHYECFIVEAGGTLVLPQAGPVVQDWSIKNLIASAGASIAGALTAASAAFTGTCNAVGGFIGNLTGDVTGNLSGTAVNAVNAAGGGTVPTADSNMRIVRGTGTGNSGKINFPTGFSSTAVTVIAVCTANDSNNNTVCVTSVDATGFNATTRNQSILIALPISYIAIGPR